MREPLDRVISDLQRLEASLREIGVTLSGVEIGGDDDNMRIQRLADLVRHWTVSDEAKRRQELVLVGIPFRLKRDRERLERSDARLRLLETGQLSARG